MTLDPEKCNQTYLQTTLKIIVLMDQKMSLALNKVLIQGQGNKSKAKLVDLVVIELN